MVMGLTLPYWSSGRRHYTMSVGLLQFHLSSDLNLTSKTFLFNLPAGQGCCLPSQGFLWASQHPRTVNLSPFFPHWLFLFKKHFLSLFLGRSGQFLCCLRKESWYLLRLGGVWDVTACARSGSNLFLKQISSLPGNYWQATLYRHCLSQ